MEGTYNKYQTQLTEEVLATLSKEESDKLFEYINGVEFIQRLISPDRKYAKDLPRDDRGRIIVDVCNPHILENMDYFREMALYYKENGVYTKLKPNPNPSSEFGQLIKREITRILDGMVRPEDGEWITGEMYFYINYWPIAQTKVKKGSKQADRVVDFPEIWEGTYLLTHYLQQARYGGVYDFDGGCQASIIARRGCGKAHPYSQLVITPDGIRKWEDIQIGDVLFGDDGIATKVIDIPYDDDSDIYTITLADGRTIDATLEHLWKIYKKHKVYIKSTKELLETFKSTHKISDRSSSGVEYRLSIPVNQPVEFQKRETLIDPYTMGILLGDGCFRYLNMVGKVAFTSHISDIDSYKRNIPYLIKKVTKDEYTYSIYIPNIGNTLSQYGLNYVKSENKFIPDEYKFNSKEIRLAVLQGLMDTDGTSGKGRSPEFSSSSKRLAEDVMFICRSLGINCKLYNKKAGYKKDGIYIPCLPSYTVKIYSDFPIFRLQRKLDSLHIKTTPYTKSKMLSSRIVDIKYSHKEKAKCVTVDNTSSCYLIGDFVVTHNSYLMSSVLGKSFTVGDNLTAMEKVTGIITAYEKGYLNSDGTLNKFVDGIDFLAEHCPFFPSARAKNSFMEMDWIMGYQDADSGVVKGTKNEVIGFSSKDNPDKGRGKRAAKFIFEEFGNFPKFINTWNTTIPSVKEGDFSYGIIITIGTGGSENSDFSGALELIYHPEGYGIYALPNVFDKATKGKSTSVFFWGAYLNRKGYYNEDGVSDVIGALISEIKERMKIKYNSSDPLTLTQRTAEWAITIQEAVLKRDGTIYPVGDLNERVTQINSNPKFRDELAIGDIVLKGGAPIFSPNTDMNPVLEFPHKDNKREGAICIYKMPVKDSNGVVMRGRFIGACLTPGEKVMTSSGLKNVEDITYNDRLINKDGEIVDINKLLIHDVVDEDVYRLKLSNTFRTTQFTKDHPILSSKIKTRYTNYKKANRLGVSERYYEFDFQFNKINDIGIGDYIKVPNIYKKVDDNILHYWEEGQLLYRTDRRISNPLLLEDFWWFVGLWLGDGWCASNGYKISVAFNKKETIYIERFKKIVTELFKRKYEVTDKQENSLEIHFCFQELNSFLTKHFGKYADGKQIPEWAKYINHDLKKQLLLGYLNSDGCVIINKQSKAVIEFVSINLTLLESFQDILFSLGLISSVKLLRPAKQRMIVGKIRKTKPCYSLLMSFHDTIKFYNFFPDYLDHKLNKVIASTQIRRKPMTDCILDKNGDYILFKITGKEHSTYTGKVYNFECKTHTFMCHHITTHNCDPYDDDSSETLSLGALYILDLYTDELVAEYVGRPMFAEEFYENCRKLLLFYNAECNYENNKKGLFKHFSQYNSLYLLSPTLDFLKEKQLMKEGLYGNKSYGTIATEPIKTYARRAIRDWLLKPRDIINVVPTEDGRQVEEVTTIRNLYTIPFKALCQELALWNSDGNFDRHDALAMLMLLREDKLRLLGADGPKNMLKNTGDELANDKFFEVNYKSRSDRFE